MENGQFIVDIYMLNMIIFHHYVNAYQTVSYDYMNRHDDILACSGLLKMRWYRYC